MRILLTNHSMADYQGSQRHTADMAVWLKEQGHDVTVAAQTPGPTGERLREHVRVCYDPAELDRYDVGIIHHNTMWADAHPRCDRTVFESQGPHEFEYPRSNWKTEPNAYSAVSEEMAVECFKPMGLAIAVVRQGVRCADALFFWKKKPVRLLLLSNAQPRIHEWVAAAKDAGLEFDALGLASLDSTGQRWHVRRHIERADIVVTIGRGAVEAACMGKYVIIDGLHGADGPLTAKTVAELGLRNYSGRTGSIVPTPEQLREWIEAYPSVALNLVTKDMRDRHDIASSSALLLQLARGELRAEQEPYQVFEGVPEEVPA